MMYNVIVGCSSTVVANSLELSLFLVIALVLPCVKNIIWDKISYYWNYCILNKRRVILYCSNLWYILLNPRIDHFKICLLGHTYLPLGKTNLSQQNNKDWEYFNKFSNNP